MNQQLVYLTKEQRIERDNSLEVVNISVGDIKDNPYQPRQKYPKNGINLLAKSISERGLLHPITVVKVGEKDFVIVGGHRRLRAFKKIHRETIPAIIRRHSTMNDLALDLAIENALRKDFAPIEKAYAIFRALNTAIPSIKGDVLRALTVINQVKLYETRGNIGNNFTGKYDFEGKDVFVCRRILRLLAMSPNTAIAYVRLLDLPKNIQRRIICCVNNSYTFVKQGYITTKMAYELTRIKNNNTRLLLYNKIVDEGLHYLTVKSIVNELIERGEEALNHLGSSKSRDNPDFGMSGLTKDILAMSSRVWNFRKKFRLITYKLDKIIYISALKKMKKSCFAMIDKINKIIREDDERERIKLINKNLEINIQAGSRFGEKLRYSFPQNYAREIGLRAGDKLILEIKEIVR